MWLTNIPNNLRKTTDGLSIGSTGRQWSFYWSDYGSVCWSNRIGCYRTVSSRQRAVASSKCFPESTINIMNLVKTLAFSLALMTLTVWGSTPASAVPLTFVYEGIIDDLGAGAGNPAFTPFLGETLRLEYTFESTTTDSDIDPTQGTYTDPTGQLTVTAGPNTYTLGGAALVVSVRDNFLSIFDQYSVGSSNAEVTGPLLGASDNVVFAFRLQDSTQTVFSSDALLLTPPDPADFNGIFFRLTFKDADDNTVGTLLATNFTIVPEPSSMFVCVSLLVGGGLFAKRSLRRAG